MKVLDFSAVIERFLFRVKFFGLKEEDILNEAKRLSGDVGRDLAKQLNVPFNPEDDLPPDIPNDIEMGEEALAAFARLRDYLNEHDPGGEDDQY